MRMANDNVNSLTENKVDKKNKERGELLIIDGEEDKRYRWRSRTTLTRGRSAIRESRR